jgi:hypothetical protein
MELKMPTPPLTIENSKPLWLQHEAHFGLVTSLHRHPSSSATSVHQAAFAPNRPLASLLLSASVDWSLRLWYATVPTSLQGTFQKQPFFGPPSQKRVWIFGRSPSSP